MLVWTNFDSFTKTANMGNLPQKFRFPKEILCNSLQTQKGLELVSSQQFLWDFLTNFFLL